MNFKFCDPKMSFIEFYFYQWQAIFFDILIPKKFEHN